MEQYIPKSALVAEIERRMKKFIHCMSKFYYASNYNEWKLVAKEYRSLISFINTLEVVDLEKDVRQILSLYYEGIKHYDDIIKEEREENGGSDLAIKIMDGVVDARELGIQYVIDKLKAQKEKRYETKER